MTTIIGRTVVDTRVATVAVIGAPLLVDTRFDGPLIAVDEVHVRAFRRGGGVWRVESISVEGEKVSAETCSPLGLRTKRVFSSAEAVGMYWISAHAPAWLIELADRALLDEVAVRP